MKLVPTEEILLEGRSGILTLTNFRIRFHAAVLGSARVESMTLAEVSLCRLRYRSFPILVVLGFLSGLCGFLMNRSFYGSIVIGGIVGVGFVVAFFLTRLHVLEFGSSAGSIVVSLSGMSTADALEFVEQAESAKIRLGSTLGKESARDWSRPGGPSKG